MGDVKVFKGGTFGELMKEYSCYRMGYDKEYRDEVLQMVRGRKAVVKAA